MISFSVCKNILNNGIKKYNSEKIKAIRDYLYFIGQIELQYNKILISN